MSSGNDLLEIDPLELKFPFELKKQISCSLQLRNKTDDYVAFKVKTTSPKKYCVRPNSGIVPPRSTADVVVTMQAQKEAPPDMQCKDKFLVQSVIVNEGANAKEITPDMFSKESGNVVDEVKLRVAYVAPPRPPSPVHEGSEEGSSPRASLSDNGHLTASEFSFSTNAYSEQKSDGEPENQSSEELALISRLTEEKNSIVQQNNKLRQELETLRREVSKKQNGFPVVLVVVMALLGILLGYIFKK
ncbi:Vesicle-associated protein 1-1 [Rhynchospora pubera]|uniref:Vesicle-associated protein 1-1 n=1 Tax=Rhynchospora pubera TaxID=906938 RepID=A0AAV8G9A2_9POAL|nr:Vesicle-associated protein 1-1 [Rhynchospora pubera]